MTNGEILYYLIGAGGFAAWVVHTCREDIDPGFRIIGIMMAISIWWPFWPFGAVALVINRVVKATKEHTDV